MTLDYRQVLEGFADAVVAADASGRIVYLNPAAERLLGWAAEELEGKPLITLIPARLHEAHRAGFARYLATRQPHLIGRSVRVPALRRDGSEIDIELSLAAVRDEGGEDLFVASLRDLSERVELERQLTVTRYLRAVTQAAARLTSHLDLEQVLGTVVETLVADFDAALARIWLHDPEANGLHLRASAGLSRETASSRRAWIDLATYPYKVGEVARTRKPFIQNGLTGDPQFEQEWIERAGIASVAVLPLLTGGELRGVSASFFREPLRDEVVEVLGAFAAIAATAVNDAHLHEREQRARRESEARSRQLQAQQRRLAFLSEAGSILVSSLDYQTTLEQVARLVVPDLADWCTIHIVEEGAFRPLVVTHVDPAKALWARDLQRRYPPDPDSPRGLPQVLRTGRPEVYPTISDALLVEAARDEEHLRLLRQVGMTSAMIVPLIARGRTLGAISFVAAESGSHYGADDLALAQELAQRAAIAIENARLYRAAQAAEQRLSTTLRSIGDAVIATDSQGRVEFMNPVAEALTGWRQEEAVGRPLEEVFTIVNEDTRQPVESPVARVLREGGIVGLANHTLLIARGGRETPIDDSGAPILDERGSVTGVVLTFHDISERRRAEAALRESEERFRTMADTAPVLIWMSGVQKEGVFFNRGWLTFTGRTLEQELGEGWFASVHPDDFPALEACSEAFARRRPFRTQFRLRRADGEYRWMLDTGVPRFAPDGTFAGYIGSCIDITEQQMAEAALRDQAEALAKAARQKDEFLAMLAHELRNPLAPIRNAAQILRLREASDLSLQRTVAIIERQIHHLSRLVDDLLDVSRITGGKIELRKERIDLTVVMREALESVSPLIEAREHELSLSLPSAPLWLEADPVRLEQVIQNLVENAAKYTEPGGRIEVSAAREGDDAVLRVRDTGVGIAPELLPRVFDLFTQADRALDRAQGGLGLGLTLVQRLVQMHGGTVSAASAGPGKGSEFIVRLPASRVAPGGKGRAASGPARGKASPRRVLVVDDNQDAAMSLADLLELAGHTARVATSGPAALEAADAFLPEIVLLDIGLPGMDGYQVARQLRGRPHLKGLFLVALTGYGQEEDRQRAAESGFDRHLVKPVEPDVLDQVLASVPGRS